MPTCLLRLPRVWGCSPKAGQTPLDVAREARQGAVVRLFEAILKKQPAHEVIAENGAQVSA